jgi:anti-sigma regulatory factor (Ser/Thr protein kinase)
LQDLSLHILDIVENSITAGATMVKVAISENVKSDSLIISIGDNGCGMDKETLKKALDPFYTTRKSRRVGLGLSMFAQAAKEAGGNFEIKSKTGKGTVVTATFSYAHIDRKPIGNMVDTLIALIATSGLNVDFTYKHKKNGANYVFDTRHVKKELDGVAINHPEVLKFLKKEIMDGLSRINERRSKT